jgi:WD40 repeat protein
MVKRVFYPVLIIVLMVSAFNIAAVQAQGFEEIASDNPSPLWQLSVPGWIFVHQVAISGDGTYIVVLYEDFLDGRIGFTYFNGPSLMTWAFSFNGSLYQSNLHGRLIDISDDGEYVVAALNNVTYNGVPTYESFLVYFNESTTRVDSYSELSDATWHRIYWGVEGNGTITCLDMNSEGSTVAIGVKNIDTNLNNVFFFPDAQSQSGENFESSGITELTSEVMDISVADFGHAVGAVTIGTHDYPNDNTLYFWDDVRPLGQESPANWTRQQEFGCVDLSGDGDRVVAGTAPIVPCGIHYWDGALTRDGSDEPETWTEHEGEDIPDIAISDDGEVIAATARYVNENGEFWVYIYDSEENALGSFPVGLEDMILEMSGDGRVVAAGGGLRDSLHVYKVPEKKPVGGEILPYNMTLIGTSYLLIALTIVMGTVALMRRIKRH